MSLFVCFIEFLAVCISLMQYRSCCILFKWINQFCESAFFGSHHFFVAFIFALGSYGLIKVPTDKVMDPSSVILNLTLVLMTTGIEYWDVQMSGILYDAVENRRKFYRMKFSQNKILRKMVQCLPKSKYKSGGPFFEVRQHGILIFFRSAFDLVVLLLQNY